MRLIDADALLDAYENIEWYTVHKTGYMTSGSTSSDNPVIHYYDGEEVIKNAPTIDAVPVVRCKDCKHSDDECHKDNLRYCMRGIRADDYNETGYIYPVEEVVRDDDFCSYGEQKEGAE